MERLRIRYGDGCPTTGRESGSFTNPALALPSKWNPKSSPFSIQQPKLCPPQRPEEGEVSLPLYQFNRLSVKHILASILESSHPTPGLAGHAQTAQLPSRGHTPFFPLWLCQGPLLDFLLYYHFFSPWLRMEEGREQKDISTLTVVADGPAVREPSRGHSATCAADKANRKGHV